MKKVDEKKLLLSIIGTIDALQQNAISIDECDTYLFKPGVITKLKEKFCNNKIIDILEEALILENLIELLPNEYDKQLSKMRVEAIAALSEYNDCSDTNWGDLFENNFSDIAEIFSLRGEEIISIYEKDNRIHLQFKKMVSSLKANVNCEIVFEDFRNAKQELFFYGDSFLNKANEKIIFADEFKDLYPLEEYTCIFNDAFLEKQCIKLSITLVPINSEINITNMCLIIYSKKCHCNWI